MAATPAWGHPAAGHRPEIDGLRALAIAPVVAHHAAPALLPGGFAGVDVFFVISGYLITAIILRELAEGRFSLLAFWERRARRIIPALAAMLAVTTCSAWAILTPEDFEQYGKALIAASVFAANIRFAQGTGYFDGVEGSLPLLHTWTLGVEEQFYIVFPLILLAAWRRGRGKERRGGMLALIGCVGAASFALALWLAPRMPLAAFYLLPTRMWELMLGAACAMLPRQPHANGRVAAVGVALVIAGILLIDPEAAAPGLLFLLPTIGAALVLLFADRSNSAGRVLGWEPLTALGLISFGLYLWHQPVLALAQYVHFGPLPVLASVAGVALSVGLAALSWRWIEEPVRRRQWLVRPALLAAACAAMLAVPLSGGIAGRAGVLLPLSGAEAQSLSGLRPKGAFDTVSVPETGAIGFVLYGDSHAGQYLDAATTRFGVGALHSENSCLAAANVSNWPPGSAKAQICAAMPGTLAELVRKRGIPTVIWAQRWERVLFDTVSGAQIGPSSDRDAAALLGAMKRTIDSLPSGTRVILVGNSPTAWAAGRKMERGWLRCRAYYNVSCSESFPAELAEGRAINAMLRDFATRDPRVTYIDAAATSCRAGRCLLVQDGRLNYWDGSHMTLAAAERVIARIDPALVARQGPVLP